MDSRALLRKTKDRFLNDSGIFMFLRSSVSSQIASWLDMGVAFVLFAFAGFYPWISTAVGAIAGGVVNCCINYRFTFHAGACSYKAVAVKYAIVWVGSLVLNTAGTSLVYEILKHWTWLETTAGFTPDGCFAAARLGVSLVVSVFWNYLLQRSFVYVPRKFDAGAVRFVDNMLHLKNRNNDN